MAISMSLAPLKLLGLGNDDSADAELSEVLDILQRLDDCLS
jgi:hypothetical protein